jgi:Rieske Fe-S protein
MFARGTWTLLTGPRLIVGRDAAGLFAFTALCTHSACTVEPPAATTGAIRCACHGSEYDGNGVVTRGPARENLDHFLVRVCDDRVRVDTAVVVATNARTPAP